MTQWKFITNHGAVLALVYQSDQITARQIADKLGITERSVARIFADLEKEGYIARIREGRTNKFIVHKKTSLRHDFARKIAVVDLLKVFNEQ